jgi:hypothetical protein
MLEFITDLDRFLAEMTIYSSPLTIPTPSSPPGLPHLPLHLHIPTEVEAVFPKGTLPLLQTPSTFSSPLGTAEINALDKAEAMFHSVSVHSEDEHLKGMDPMYRTPPPSLPLSSPSASFSPLNNDEVLALDIAEVQDQGLLLGCNHRFFHRTCFVCHQLGYWRMNCPRHHCMICL